MPIFDIFSKRQKRQRGEVPDVYVYDELPEPLRVQLVHIIQDALGTTAEHGHYAPAHRYYKGIVKILRREYGRFLLVKPSIRDPDVETELLNFLLQTPEVDQALDVVELAMRTAEEFETTGYPPQPSPETTAAVAELNARFQENAVGYRYESGKIIRVDSDLLHAEAVKPALTLLHAAGYEGPLKEFLTAHEHYRHGRTESAIVEALKAFESTMKVICDKKGWKYKKGDTAARLIDVCLKKGLVESFWQSHFSTLRCMLESSIPTARNNAAGHGRGSEVRDVPEHLAGYVMQMTASTVVFLIRSAEAMA